MKQPGETSDQAILDLLRRRDNARIADFVDATGVTATAVRQRLSRLIRDGLVVRSAERAGRGRPSFHYALSKKGERAAGTNYSELAKTLWEEIRAIDEPGIRRGLLKRIADRLSVRFSSLVVGETVTERMSSMASLMESRGMPCDFDDTGELPVLSALSCPYPDLAETDRSVCAMERMFLAEVLGGDVSLAECRLDGGSCCSFEGSGRG